MMRRESAFSNEPQTVGDLMTAPDTDTLIALAREGRIAVVPVEATDQMTAAWPSYNKGAGHERSIYNAMLSASPTLTPALLALAEERDRLREAVTRALRIVSEMERQTKVIDSYASDLPKSERNTSELWLICNGHIKDRASEIRRALAGDTP